MRKPTCHCYLFSMTGVVSRWVVWIVDRKSIIFKARCGSNATAPLLATLLTLNAVFKTYPSITKLIAVFVDMTKNYDTAKSCGILGTLYRCKLRNRWSVWFAVLPETLLPCASRQRPVSVALLAVAITGRANAVGDVVICCSVWIAVRRLS